MAEQGAQEKTEAPTPKKREEARKEGQVAMSKEVTSAALLGTFTLYFLVTGQAMLEQLAHVWRYHFQEGASLQLTPDTVYREYLLVMQALTGPMLGLFAVALVVGLIAPALQVGVLLTPLKFQASRMSPLQGLKRIFSAQGAAELFKGLFKMGVIGYVTYITLNGEVNNLLDLSSQPIQAIFVYNFQLLATLFGQVALALVILAVFDYMFQRWNFEQKIKMTKQEVKDEMKQTEGDPQLRSRVRQVQREMSQARMMESVPKADVVVTNPIHYAVALMYDREVMDAPRVVAKGADFLAQRIKTVARENDVPLVENRAVARELYAQVEIGQEIPEHFFRTVAEILAYVYRLKGEAPGSQQAG